MAIVQIAPGVFVDTEAEVGNFSGEAARVANQAISQAQTIQAGQVAQAAQTAQQTAAARLNAAQMYLNRRIGESRARRRATLRSLQILGDEKKKKKGQSAQVSKGETGEVKKKRTTASLRIGGTGAAPGGGLNIAV